MHDLCFKNKRRNRNKLVHTHRRGFSYGALVEELCFRQALCTERWCDWALCSKSTDPLFHSFLIQQKLEVCYWVTGCMLIGVIGVEGCLDAGQEANYPDRWQDLWESQARPHCHNTAVKLSTRLIPSTFSCQHTELQGVFNYLSVALLNSQAFLDLLVLWSMNKHL